jgi:hypothetical protein
VSWLNNRHQTSEHQRIVHLLANLSLIRNRHGEGKWTVADEEFAQQYPDLIGLSMSVRDLPSRSDRKYTRALREARAELSKHRMWPDLESVASPKGPSQASSMAFGWKCAQSPVTRAVLQIMLLGQEGLLSRVRSCLKCRRWFFARFRHQNFCETPCQQKFYRDNPEWREGRRKYMQKYRRLNS